MGSAKALLDWKGTPAVAHLVAILRAGVDGGPVVVVGAPGQALPALDDALLTEDGVASEGPLRGLEAGLIALEGLADVAFVSGVDTPLLEPAFVRSVLAALREGDDAVVPVIGGREQPLLAAYRVSLGPRIAEVLAAGVRSMGELGRHCSARALGEDDLLADPLLAAADPTLRSARNANSPTEWANLLAEA